VNLLPYASFTCPSYGLIGKSITVLFSNPENHYTHLRIIYTNENGEQIDEYLFVYKIINGEYSFSLPNNMKENSTFTLTTYYYPSNASGINQFCSPLYEITKRLCAKSNVINPPQIILPSAYTLTISEGENVKIKGESTNINDYKIIYAKAHCDVAKAVAAYDTKDAYYAAPRHELRKNLLENASGVVDYYILKDFDQELTFIQQDSEELNVFHIRTPDTKEYSNIEDFYALQWLDGLEPSDLVYLYAIERKHVEKIKEIVTNTHNDIQCRVYNCEACKKNNHGSMPESNVSEIVHKEYIYSDNNYNNISYIDISRFTPYIVLPPAVKPLEISYKIDDSNNIIFNYGNPFYNKKANVYSTYNKIASLSFDMSTGNNKENSFDETSYDSTLNIGESRYVSYIAEAKWNKTLSEYLSDSLKDIYFDISIKSIDNKVLRFDSVTSNDIALQLLIPKKTVKGDANRILDIPISDIDNISTEYNFSKIQYQKRILATDLLSDNIQFVYNMNSYLDGKTFPTEDWQMKSGSKFINKLGWEKNGSSFYECTFTSSIYDLIYYINRINNEDYEIRLVLENYNSPNGSLFAPPSVNLVSYFDNEAGTKTPLEPLKNGTVNIGDDIKYVLPTSLLTERLDTTLSFSLLPKSPFPLNLNEIVYFSNAYIEVVKKGSSDEIKEDEISKGFTVEVNIFEKKHEIVNIGTNIYEPIQLFDLIICCFDNNGNLLGKSNKKRRDIYNGKDFIYYTERFWHNFFIDNNKKSYSMIYHLPANTERVMAIGFNYSNWHDNPSIYSMSELLITADVSRDAVLEFTSPVPTYDSNDQAYTAKSYTSNPVLKIRLNSINELDTNDLIKIARRNKNLATTLFDKNIWLSDPLIFSNAHYCGYEQPVFSIDDYYIGNCSEAEEDNIILNGKPSYNVIEYYNEWKDYYGKDVIKNDIPNDESLGIESVDIKTNYTIFENNTNVSIYNNSIPYINIPSSLFKYDKSKIVLYIDADFDYKKEGE
jgi:hypothetical protein